ncbi:MAG TPA: hypothetical protein PKH07_06580, partial [bacterium]|nr:hypothetical protein [bacterium]
RDGWCEVFPDERPCVWVRAYRNLGAEEAEKQFADQTILPRNHALDQTASWLNYYAERDHEAHYGIAPEERPPSLFDQPEPQKQAAVDEPSAMPEAPPDQNQQQV